MARNPELAFTQDTKDSARKKYNHKCALCGGQETFNDPFEIDHIIPLYFAELYPFLSHAALASVANARPVHKSCHIKRDHFNEHEVLEMLPKVVNDFIKIRKEEQQMKRKQNQPNI